MKEAYVCLFGTEPSGKTSFREVLRTGKDQTKEPPGGLGWDCSILDNPPFVDCQPMHVQVWEAYGWPIHAMVESHTALRMGSVVLFFLRGIYPDDDKELYALHDYIVPDSPIPPDAVIAVVCSHANMGVNTDLHNRVTEWASHHNYPYFEIDCHKYDQVANVFDELFYKWVRAKR